MRVFLFVLAISAVGCTNTPADGDWWKQSSVYQRSEPTELFFEPSDNQNDRYWRANFECCPEKQPIVRKDARSSSSLSYRLRPIDALVLLPTNTVHSISKQYQVWAETIWDIMLVEVLLPTFEGKSDQTELRFKSRSDPDLVEIRLGFLGGDFGPQHLRERVSDGRMVEVTLESDRAMNLRAYRVTSLSGESDAPTTYLGDESVLRSLSGNPIVFSCSAWPTLGSDSQRCRAELTLPIGLWPEQMRKSFGGSDGLQVVYTFPKKHLSAWAQLVPKINAFTISLLPDLSTLRK